VKPCPRPRVPALASAARGDPGPSDAGRTNIRWLGLCCVAVFSWTGTGCAPALAGQVDYGTGFALGHESNITRSPTDPRAEWTQSLFGGIGYTERTADLRADFVAQVERRMYVRNTYQDETLPFLNGVAVWSMVPQLLTWTVEDVARESLLTLSAPDTPTNRVKANSLSTGPQLTFRANPTNAPILGARYGRYDVEGPGDNQRYSGYGGWLYKFSELDSLSLNYVATRVNFDPPSLYTNFLRQDQFLLYKRVSVLNSLIIEGGTTHIRRYGGEETSGRLARVSALYGLTSGSAVRLLLSDQISDSATDLIRGLAYETTTKMMPVIPTEAAAVAPLGGSNVATTDIYRSQRGEVTYVMRSGRIESSLQGYARRVDYVTLNQDYNEAGGRLALSWIPSDTLRIYADANFGRRTFPSLDERDTDRIGTLGVTYRLTPGLFVSAEGGRVERESNIPLQNFLDRRFLLVLGYSTGPLYSPNRR
jgi:hypothetical protein